MIIKRGIQLALLAYLAVNLLACAHTIPGDDFVAVDRYEAAADIYVQAAENGDLKEMLRLAAMYAAGKVDYRRDYVKAAYWYQKAAETGHIAAMYELAFIYEYGQGEIEEDLQQAAYWYRRAAEQGDAYSRYRLGGVLAKTDPVDRIAAMQWLLLAEASAQDCPKQAICQIVLEDMFNYRWVLQQQLDAGQMREAEQRAQNWQSPVVAP